MIPSSPLLATTLQNCLLGGLSNLLAQGITAYKSDTDFEVDWIPVSQFVLFGIINTPPNFIWQEYLEATFPAYPSPSSPSPSSSEKQPPPSSSSSPPTLSIRNTLLKTILDQTLGAALNTLLFSLYIHSFRSVVQSQLQLQSTKHSPLNLTTLDFTAVDYGLVWAAAREDFWNLMFAGWKVWPLVALVNYTLVKTVQGRSLVGGLAGLGWGVYVSLVAAR